ncbi:MAG TPA: glutamate-1-semialdehyde 2,1-aminomutase [bacterium]|nr:glutamate-1-semialdehyde 2,1-aminomutase [bacterium]
MTKPSSHLPGARSTELFARAQQSIVGGVNSPVRAFRSVGMGPLFIQRGHGSRIVDVDGNEFIDYVGSWGPLILGHAHEAVLEAVQRVLRNGTSFGAPTELEVQLAEQVKDFVPSLERLRFVNSGNEATQGALRVARGFTGRDYVVKFAGCYHGSVDSLLVKAGSGATTLGVADSKGVPAASAGTTLVAEFNDLDSVIQLVEEYPGEIAAVILEYIPGNMGVIAPELPFLRGLRDLCDREGMLLICDEVMTGFRVARGGAQSLFDVPPDLSTFGKVIGGGFPVGAYGGRADVMAHIAPEGPVYQAGTLSGNPVAMAAGLATLKLLEDESVYSDLAAKTQRLTDAFSQIAGEGGVALQTTCFGGMFGFFFGDARVRNYTDALASRGDLYPHFFRGMLEHGVYLAPSPYEAAFVSTAHSDADLEQTIEAFRYAVGHL